MGRKVNYFEAQRPHNPTENSSLAVVVCSVLGSTLSAIESRKPRSFWLDAAAFTTGYDALSRQQWELLMDATDRIVSEIRALRNGVDTDVLSRNPQTDPYTLALTSLNDVRSVLTAPDGRTAGELLALLADANLSEEQREEVIGLIRNIAALLAAL